MAMTVLGTDVLAKAGKKNAPLRRALAQWLDATANATWGNIHDVKQTFPTVSSFPVTVKGGGQVTATVFNIKGNEYRLITVIIYAAQTVGIRELLTHAEYDRNVWKERL